jgi:hypothetical protein
VGSSGAKRKGRRHLPKVGTRPANEHQLHDRREAALHPFSEDPFDRRRSPTTIIVAILVAVVVLIGIVAIVAAT